MKFLLIVTFYLYAVSPAAAQVKKSAMHYWPQWRGPLATGVAPHAEPPVSWSENKNVRWKVALPGVGHATPIIWGDRIFITTAVPYGENLQPISSNAAGAHNITPVTQRHKFMVTAVNRLNGKTVWERVVKEDVPREGVHYTASHASNSPVTDGHYIFAFFGSQGLYCLDFQGTVLWKKDLGDMHTMHAHGEGSSPALHGDYLIINWDHEGKSFLIAFDKRTGTERWKVERTKGTSWTTPIVVEHEGKLQVIVSGSERVQSYDLSTGAELWKARGLSVENVVSSPVSGDGMVFAGSTYDKQAMLAIRLDGASGDITNSGQIAWQRTRGASYVPSPLLYGKSLYFLYHYKNILTRVHAQTGADSPGTFRLNGIGSVFASPVGAAGRVYITDREGATLVISHSDTPEILAHNQLEDSFSASPALVGGEIYLRGQKYLYCIARPD